MCEQCRKQEKSGVFLEFFKAVKHDNKENLAMSKHDLIVVNVVFKIIDKYGLDGAKAYFDVENKKRELVDAYLLKSALCTKNEE